MSVATLLEMVLAAVVLGLGVWAIAARQTYAATVGFVAYGLLVPLVWVRLDAIDVAFSFRRITAVHPSEEVVIFPNLRKKVVDRDRVLEYVGDEGHLVELAERWAVG